MTDLPPELLLELRTRFGQVRVLVDQRDQLVVIRENYVALTIPLDNKELTKIFKKSIEEAWQTQSRPSA